MKMKPNLEFMLLISERNVPWHVERLWLDELIKLKTQRQRDAFFLQKIEEIKANYPYISKEDFLRKADTDQDWEALSRKYYIYWQETYDMLKDAVILDLRHVAAYVAPHCLFGAQERYRECLALAKGEEMKQLLGAAENHTRDEKYSQTVFCLKSSAVRRGHQYVHRLGEVLSFDEEIQKQLWKDFVNMEADGNEALLMKQTERIRASEDDYAVFKWNDKLRALGYMYTKTGFKRRKLPDYWTNGKAERSAFPDESERLKNWAVHLYGLMAKAGWDVKSDLIGNWFGSTGYLYVESIHASKEGNGK